MVVQDKVEAILDKFSARLEELDEIVKQKKMEEKQTQLARVKQLYDQLGMEHDAELDTFSTKTLNELEKGLMKLLEQRSQTQATGDEPVARVSDGNVQIDEYGVKDAIVDMIATAYGLEIPPDDIKQEVKLMHMAQNIDY